MFVSFLLLSFPTFSLFLSRRSSPAAGRSRSRCRSSSRSGRTYGHNNRLPVIREKNLPSPSIETEISFAIVFLVVKSDARKFRCLKNGPLQRLFSGKHSLALIPLSLNKFASITEQSVFKFAYDDATVTVFFSSKSVGRSSVTSSCFSRLVVNYLSFRQKYDDCENLEILFFPDNFFLQFLDKILKNDERWKKLQ